jgi:hypothetical protein
MQSLKRSDLTKLEEFGVWLAANGDPDTRPAPAETGNPPPSAPSSAAESLSGNPTAV